MEHYENKPQNSAERDIKEREELRDMFGELCSRGSYSESFDVLRNGKIAFDHRLRDGTPPLLPNLLAAELGTGDVEAFYRLAHDIQRKLPEFEFAVSENPERTLLTCRISRRAD
jgi:hypothetical protein